MSREREKKKIVQRRIILNCVSLRRILLRLISRRTDVKNSSTCLIKSTLAMLAKILANALVSVRISSLYKTMLTHFSAP